MSVPPPSESEAISRQIMAEFGDWVYIPTGLTVARMFVVVTPAFLAELLWGRQIVPPLS